MPEPFFIDIETAQAQKHRQAISGDAFLSRKLRDEGRVVSVLADGLGSGVKASVLATLTSTMAVNFIGNHIDASRAARIILDSLPVCKTRGIGYSTFTITDIDSHGRAAIIEHDNPPVVLFRGSELLELEKLPLAVGTGRRRTRGAATAPVLQLSRFAAQEGDRLILCSDGVTQSGMGGKIHPLGWGRDAMAAFVRALLRQTPDLSARDLAQRLVDAAAANDGGEPKDDVTCAVIHFRTPRHLLLLAGPPFDRARDAGLAELFRGFRGRRVICGGTTAGIIARETGCRILPEADAGSPDVPPAARLEGADLVTEGTITLGLAAEMLEAGGPPRGARPNAASRLVSLLLESDVIRLVIGTRVNEAHQDPNVPVELEIRRNIAKKIRLLLEEKHLKETTLQFI